jgi:hypothetical protein
MVLNKRVRIDPQVAAVHIGLALQRLSFRRPYRRA